jgi:type II secretory pathway component PulF
MKWLSANALQITARRCDKSFDANKSRLTSVKEKGREIGIPKIGGRKKVKSKDLSIFTRQFSVMIDAGLPLVQCPRDSRSTAGEQIFSTDTAAGQARC